jgi:hypothetical protein
MLGLASLQPTPPRHSPRASTGFGITSRNDDAHASSVASIEPPAIAAPMIPESWGQRGKTSSKPQL